MVACAANKNNLKSKKTKYILEDMSAAPDNPTTEEVEMALPQKDDTMPYGENLALALVTWTMKEEVSGTNQEVGKGMDPKFDTFSPWWIGTPEMGGAMPPLQKHSELKEEEKETTSAEEVPMMKSPPLCIAWREEKKRKLEEKGPTVALVIPMLQKLTKEGPQYTITSADWGKCVWYVAGQRKPGQLYLRQAIEAEILLIEALDELEPPKGIEDVDWEGFKGYTEHVATDIYGSRGRIMLTRGGKRDATKYSGHADKSGTESIIASSKR